MAKIAPLSAAEDWDNVGWLIVPPRAEAFSHALLTIDLTFAVLEEARIQGAQVIVAYHPPVFRGLKRVRAHGSIAPEEQVVAHALSNGIAVYSPHTALDAAEGGVSDWLAAGLGAADAVTLNPAPPASVRVRRLTEPVSVAALGERLKLHLNVPYLRVGTPTHVDKSTHQVVLVAVCPGAGGSAFEGVECEAYVTGEMRHHDVLRYNARGKCVVLSEHSHTERGYLLLLKKRMESHFSGLAVAISSKDADPLTML